MKYEIWTLVNDGAEVTPMFKAFETQDSKALYTEYAKLSETGPHIIVYNGPKPIDGAIHVGADVEKPWIYESPDGGKTLYRRRFGMDERERIRK